MANNTIIHGWQDQPVYHGTFNIIKVCVGMIFLLCWSSVCPNIPSLKGGFWLTFRMKFALFLLAILGPNFIFPLGTFAASSPSSRQAISAYVTW